ncbi:hypothetical protein UFOVP182_38 [uncultured Caudovirales phage]|uniref:Uncharacterized protein n=1 Tax=uncultured Caudovirales phage TaxID=2100421 RepID=A0A6J7WKG6_9CAUD|nr:hypothetical protein UFOVP182_38 [uncultured Caudovirales phage]
MKTTTAATPFMKVVQKKDLAIQFWCFLDMAEDRTVYSGDQPDIQGDISLNDLIEEYYEDWCDYNSNSIDNEGEYSFGIDDGEDLLDFLNYAIEDKTTNSDYCSLDLGFYITDDEGEFIEEDEMADWNIAWLREQRLLEIGL